MVSIIEVISSPLFLVVYMFAVVSTIVLGLSFKYAIFGVKAFVKKMSGKYGLMFLKMPGGDIKFPPYFVNIEKTEVTLKSKGVTKKFPYTRTDFDEGRFFSFPYCIKDHDDCIRSYGLYGQVTNSDLKPLYHVVEIEGKKIQTDIPVLTKEKSSGVVDPELIHGMISKAGILDNLKELFDKNKILLYVVMASIAVSVISLYVGYENYSMIQQMQPMINQIASNVATKAAEGVTSGALIPAP
ncbi:hypothetical protein [Lutibacter sp.]|uniref:hypothetical protein n=1 Tax=Lutibacter sp. TaxID=1925666 RepID=UPI0034A05906